MRVAKSAYRRRPRQMSFKDLDRRIKRDEVKTSQREFGRWNNVYIASVFNLNATTRGGQIMNIGPGGLTTSPKTTYYGFDGLISLTVKSPNSQALCGYLAQWTAHEGQNTSDFWDGTGFVPLSGVDANAKARITKFLPFTLLGDENATRGSVVIPWQALLPKRKLLKPSEHLVNGFGVYGAAVISITVQCLGRYRYIEGTV